GECFVAQQVRRYGRATKVDVFNQQIGSDDGISTGRAAHDSSVVANTCDKRISRCPGTSPQGIDKIEFAFGGTVVVGTLFLFVSHPQRLRRSEFSPASIVSIEVENEKRK